MRNERDAPWAGERHRLVFYLELSGFISKIFLKDTGGVAVHFSDGIEEYAVIAVFFNANRPKRLQSRQRDQVYGDC